MTQQGLDLLLAPNGITFKGADLLTGPFGSKYDLTPMQKKVSYPKRKNTGKTKSNKVRSGWDSPFISPLSSQNVHLKI
jgi:hypothetical protein